jgi:hypothetical protein
MAGCLQKFQLQKPKKSNFFGDEAIWSW